MHACMPTVWLCVGLKHTYILLLVVWTSEGSEVRVTGCTVDACPFGGTGALGGRVCCGWVWVSAQACALGLSRYPLLACMLLADREVEASKTLVPFFGSIDSDLLAPCCQLCCSSVQPPQRHLIHDSHMHVV